MEWIAYLASEMHDGWAGFFYIFSKTFYEKALEILELKW